MFGFYKKFQHRGAQKLIEGLKNPFFGKICNCQRLLEIKQLRNIYKWIQVLLCLGYILYWKKLEVFLVYLGCLLFHCKYFCKKLKIISTTYLRLSRRFCKVSLKYYTLWIKSSFRTSGKKYTSSSHILWLSESEHQNSTHYLRLHII